MSKVLTKLFVPAFLLLLCPACITEVDVGACENTEIKFEYPAGEEGSYLPDEVESITYLVYDSEGNLVLKGTIDKKDLDDGLGNIKFRLPDGGDYKIVIWGNTGDNCIFEGEDHYETLHVVNPSPNPDDFDKIYIGEIDVNLDSPDDLSQTEIPPVHNSNVTIDITLDSTLEEGGTDYVVKIGPLPSGIDKDGNPTGPYVYYEPKLVEDEDGKIVTVIDVPPFGPDTDAVIQIIDPKTGEVVAEVPLKDYIEENDIDLSTEDPKIEIEIAVSGTTITVKFPGWKPKPVYPHI